MSTWVKAFGKHHNIDNAQSLYVEKKHDTESYVLIAEYHNVKVRLKEDNKEGCDKALQYILSYSDVATL